MLLPWPRQMVRHLNRDHQIVLRNFRQTDAGYVATGPKCSGPRPKNDPKLDCDACLANVAHTKGPKYDGFVPAKLLVTAWSSGS
jgi:hypothetical protein